MENESGKTLNRVQNGLKLQLNSWSPCRVFALPSNSQITRISGDQLFGFTALDDVAPSMGGGGERRRRLPNSSSRRRRSRGFARGTSPCDHGAAEARLERGQSVTEARTKRDRSVTEA